MNYKIRVWQDARFSSALCAQFSNVVAVPDESELTVLLLRRIHDRDAPPR